MLRVSAKVKANTSGIASKVKRIAKDDGLGNVLASTANDGMAKFVPKRSGALVGSGQASPFKVTYNTPYARRMYYGEGFNFSKDRNPLAQARWDRGYMQAGGIDELVKTGTNYLRGK